jgi:hypothetical protein
MEEGSLLQQVLQRQGQEDEKNAILLDVFSLKEGLDHTLLLLLLADLAKQCNEFLHSQNHLWHNGGDGPVFGVHVGGDGIPHLRAYCFYGPSIQDEWMSIDLCFQLSQNIKEDIAISCWDVDDGQVILIQTADVLPQWLDEDPSDDHRYACFIRKGQIQLIQQAHVTLYEALKTLRNQRNNESSSHPEIQINLNKWLDINRRNIFQQKTALVLPRKVATLIRKRPDLVHTAIQAFCERIEEKPPSISHHEDWIWATHQISRTNYAMARTLLSKEWESPDFLPKLPIEVKRYKRQCAMEATPHLQQSLQLGVRIVVGFEFLSQSKLVPPSLEERMAHWCRLEQDCNDCNETSWILKSFQRGPNYSAHDLTHILRCPVFPEEKEFPTLYSNSEVSLKQQLLNAQNFVDEDEDFSMPSSNEVDNESWLDLEHGNGLESNDLDGVLSKFKKFMVQPSALEGVASEYPEPRIKIRPRVFMNILYNLLKGEELSFPSSDPFFYQEDYDLMEHSNEIEEGEPDEAMRGIMVRHRRFFFITFVCVI